MKEPGKSWKSIARAIIGVLLLLWIVHSIFVNEARTRFAAAGQQDRWRALSRPEQWQHGWRMGPPALARSLSSVEAPALAASLALMGGMIYLGAVRWRVALQAQGLDLPHSQVLRISLVAHFFNALLLGTAGGDVAKAYYAARETHHRKTEAVLTVLADRVIGLWAMLLFGGLMLLPNRALLRHPDLRTMAAFLLAMLAVSSLFVFIAFRGGLSRAWSGAHACLLRLPKGQWIERTLDSCRVFGRTPWFVARTLGLSMCVNLLLVLQFLALARGLHIPISLGALALVVPVVICIAALPVSPSGLGVRENLFVYLLALPAIAVPATPALSLSLLAYASSLAWSLLGGLAYLTLQDRRELRELAAEE